MSRRYFGMIHANSTPVPNCLFDSILPTLKPAELKILLIIIRQTYGWIDPRFPKKRKQFDWISQSQFQHKTGLSRKAVSTGLASLIGRKLVHVYDACGLAVEGSGKGRKFYAFACFNEQNLPKNRVKNAPQTGNFLPSTKEIITKTNTEKFKKELEMAGGFRQLMAQKGIIRMDGREVVMLDPKRYQYWEEVERKIR